MNFPSVLKVNGPLPQKTVSPGNFPKTPPSFSKEEGKEVDLFFITKRFRAWSAELEAPEFNMKLVIESN